MKKLSRLLVIMFPYFILAQDLRARSDEDNLVWVSVTIDVADGLASDPEAAAVVQEVHEDEDAGLVLIGLDAELLPALIYKIQNDLINHEGGFVVHPLGKDAGLAYMDHVKSGDQSVFSKPEIDNHEVGESLLQSVDTSEMMEFYTDLIEDFSTRYAYSKEGAKASKWIKKQFEEVSSPRNDIEVKTVKHPKKFKKQKSIIVTIPGSEEPEEIVIIGAHLDSISDLDGKMTKNKPAPGADDDGSGIAVIMEALRVIVQNGYVPKKTVQIMAFAAEELGLVGSEDIASQYRADNKNVIGMLMFDMVGNRGMIDFALTKDYSNSDHTDFVASLIKEYLPSSTYVFFTNGYYEASDHAAWNANDYPSTMTGETEKNPFYHTEQDVLKNIDEDCIGNFAKLALAYLAELAKGTIS